jgi:hypothetical protein
MPPHQVRQAKDGRRIGPRSDKRRRTAQSRLDLREDRKPAVLGPQDMDAQDRDVAQHR